MLKDIGSNSLDAIVFNCGLHYQRGEYGILAEALDEISLITAVSHTSPCKRDVKESSF